MCCHASKPPVSPTGPASGPGGSDGGSSADGGAGCPTCKLVSITVIQNATQTNVTGAKNWATVKKGSDDVIVQAKTDPDTPDCWSKISWSGDSGDPVPGRPNQRKFTRAAPKHYNVKASLGGVNDSLDIWVLWAELEIKIGSGDTIDTGNDAAGLAAGHTWPAQLGGGNKLGPITSESTTLTYAYTIGKIQAKATLAPAGIEDVVQSGWHMKRKKTKKAFDNGALSNSATDSDDTSQARWKDEDPKTGTSTREIYDLDGPGCSNTLPGTAVNHTAEIYENFVQYVTVTLDTELLCSDEKQWSYTAQVDTDKATGKVEKNELRLSHITIPAGSKYSPR